MRGRFRKRDMESKERFREEIYLFPRYLMNIFLLLSIICIWVIIQQPSITLALFLFVIISIPLLFGKMIIIVNDEELIVMFGYIERTKSKIALSNIRFVEKVVYRPIRDFGGWGIRCGRFRGERVNCLSLKGNEGLLLTLIKETRVCLFKTNKLIIGSKEPEKLVRAIGKDKQFT